MFRNTQKALRGFRFVVSNYEDYRLRFEYDEEANIGLSLWRVKRNMYGVEEYTFCKHIDMTDIYEQCADIAGKLEGGIENE